MNSTNSKTRRAALEDEIEELQEALKSLSVKRKT
jgi:flagellin-like hook-associated protein FlgL